MSATLSLVQNTPSVIGTSATSSSEHERNLAAHYDEALRQAASSPLPEDGLSIYIHLPFCPSRCLSCDHNTTVTHNPGDIDTYIDTLDAEMALITERLGQGRLLQQLHLGGGTPNYLSDTQLVRLVSVLEKHFTIGPDTETSLEANPKRTSAGQLALLRGLGFRRINFEVRDLDPGVQMALGRSQSSRMLADVFETTRDAGFETISMDLVYGLPNQSLETVCNTLRQVLELAPDRVACFSYSRRPDTFSHQRAIDDASLPSLADRMVMMNATANRLQDGGYTWIGLDCFAREGDVLEEAQAEHRLHRNWIGYTLHECTDLIGFGTNAVTELGNLCVQNHLDIKQWQDSILGGRLPIGNGVQMSRGDQAKRRALNDLMCNMSLSDYASLRMLEGDALDELQQGGMVQVSEDRVEVTPEGRFMLHQMWGDASPLYRWGGAW